MSLRLNFHGGQRRAWDSEARIVAMLAGSQSGKTCLAPWWLAREITRCGPGDYLAITSSYGLFQLKFLPEMLKVFEHTLGVGRFWSGNKVIELRDPEGAFWASNQYDPMWGRIILRSAAAGSGLESATAKAAIIDEGGQDEFTLAHWEAILARLSLNRGRALIGTSLYNFGWLKTEVYDPWKRGDPGIEVVQFASTLNPAFPPEELAERRNKMQDWRFSMRYLGEYERPASLIYGCVEDKHWIEPFDVPHDWPVVAGVDPSGSHFASLWLAQNPDGKWFAFRESFAQGQTTAENVASVIGQIGLGQRCTFVGGGPSEGQERRDWRRCGLQLREPPITGVDAGIDRAVGMVKSGRLFFFRSLTETRREIDTYRRKMDESTGEVLTDIVDKSRFHHLDCLRAAASQITDGRGLAAKRVAVDSTDEAIWARLGA